jgi:hypothetical protein
MGWGVGCVAWHTITSDSHGGKMIPCGRTLKADFGLLVPLVYEIKGHRVGAAPIGRTPQGWFRHTVAPLVTRRRHFIRSVYETQNQSLANGTFDGATTLRCAPLTFGTFSDSLRPYGRSLRNVPQSDPMEIPPPSSCIHAAPPLHLLLSITHEICMRFHP